MVINYLFLNKLHKKTEGNFKICFSVFFKDTKNKFSFELICRVFNEIMLLRSLKCKGSKGFYPDNRSPIAKFKNACWVILQSRFETLDIYSESLVHFSTVPFHLCPDFNILFQFEMGIHHCLACFSG
jgi:hypothetical protein